MCIKKKNEYWKKWDKFEKFNKMADSSKCIVLKKC